MTPRQSPTDRAQGLIEQIDAEANAEIEAILRAAEEDAARILKAAHRKARAKVSAAIEELRRLRAREMARAAARLETKRRQMRQAAELEALAQGLDTLPAELRAVWQDEAARAAWSRAVVSAAGQHLLPGKWRLDHPADMPAGEIAKLTGAIAEVAGQPPETRPDPGLVAGIRITANGARIDGSAEALAADRARLSALFLGELDGAEGAETT